MTITDMLLADSDSEAKKLRQRVAELEATLAWARLAYQAVQSAEAIAPHGLAGLLEQAPAIVVNPPTPGADINRTG